MNALAFDGTTVDIAMTAVCTTSAATLELGCELQEKQRKRHAQDEAPERGATARPRRDRHRSQFDAQAQLPGPLPRPEDLAIDRQSEEN
jgi:hypothetical protein